LKSFNSELNADIEKLKLLHAKKDKADFNRLKTEIMLKHSISVATVYREMKKQTPGFYKKPDYNPPHRPVTEKEIQMIAELLIKGKDVQDIAKLMQRKTGDKYTWDRITQIRKIIDVRLDKKTENTPVPEETAFGDKLRDFIETMFELDNISPGCKLTAWVSGGKLELAFSDIKDIELVLLNSASSGGKNGLSYMKRKIFHLLTDKLRRAEAFGAHSLTFKDIAETSRLYREFERDELEGFSPDYRVLVAVVTALKPDASYAEILELAQKYHEEITGSSKYIVPYEMWLRDQTDFAPYTELYRGLLDLMERGEAVITDPGKVFPFIKDNVTEFMGAYVKLYEMYLGKERLEHNMKVGAFKTLHEEAEIRIRAKQNTEPASGLNIMGEPRMSLNPDEWED